MTTYDTAPNFNNEYDHLDDQGIWDAAEIRAMIGEETPVQPNIFIERATPAQKARTTAAVAHIKTLIRPTVGPGFDEQG